MQPRPGTPDGAKADDIIERPLGTVDRNRESETDRASGTAREDERVDADHLTLGVDERAARVARVYGGVGLNHVRPDLRLAPRAANLGLYVAAKRRDHTHRDGRVAVSQEVAVGIADRDHPLTDQHVVGVAQRGYRQIFAFNPEESEIGRLVCGDQLAIQLAAVHQRDHDVSRATHDVLVGNHVTILGDDETGAQVLNLPQPFSRWEETAKERIIEWTPLTDDLGGDHVDRNDRWPHAFGSHDDRRAA